MSFSVISFHILRYLSVCVCVSLSPGQLETGADFSSFLLRSETFFKIYP